MGRLNAVAAQIERKLDAYEMAKKKRRKGRMSKILVVVAIVGAAAWWLYKQTAKISIGGAAATVHKLNPDGVELRIKLSVVNEANATIDVQTFLGQLFYKGVSMGIVQQLDPVTIPPLKVGYVEFKTTISWVTLGFNGYNVFQIYQQNQGTNDQGQPNPQTALVDWAAFKIKGTLRAENISIPIESTIFV